MFQDKRAVLGLQRTIVVRFGFGVQNILYVCNAQNVFYSYNKCASYVVHFYIVRQVRYVH